MIIFAYVSEFSRSGHCHLKIVLPKIVDETYNFFEYPSKQVEDDLQQIRNRKYNCLLYKDGAYSIDKEKIDEPMQELIKFMEKKIFTSTILRKLGIKKDE